MKKTGTWFTLAFLVATVVVIFTALVVQASRGPSFRAADYADMNECVRNIPVEWLPGGLEYSSAETSCYYIHVRDRP
ncbi:MAG: hypothetical protein WD960_10045 [Gemmatimonadota bacterium]